MSSIEDKIYKIASEVHTASEREVEILKGFYDSKLIDDYEFEFEILFFEDWRDYFNYSEGSIYYAYRENEVKELLEDYDSSNMLEYLYKSILSWYSGDFLIRKKVPRIDFVIYRTKSYYQFFSNISAKNSAELESVLAEIYLHALSLRDEINKTVLKEFLEKKDKKFLKYNLYLDPCFLSEDKEWEIYLPPSDLKYLPYHVLRDLELLRNKRGDLIRRIKSFGCAPCRELRYFLSACNCMELQIDKLKEIMTSIILEKEYFIDFTNFEKDNKGVKNYE